MNLPSATASVLLLAAGATAQSHIVLPMEAAQRPGNRLVPDVFFGTKEYLPRLKNESRIQILYDMKQISVTQAKLKALALRGPANYGVHTVGKTINLTVSISTSPVVHDQASRTFAQNHGINKTQVFSGSYKLPPGTNTPWPRPWLTPIVFQTPFAFDRSKGNSLVIELLASGGSADSTWTVEAYGIDRGLGKTEFIDTRCRNSAGTASNGFGQNRDLHIGGQFYLDIATYPNGTPSLATNLLFFGLSGVGSTWAGHVLPVDLNLLGLPSRPYCKLAIVPFASMPMAVWDPVGVPGTRPATHLHLKPPIKIPNDPLLINLRFYTQNIALDTDRSTGKTFLFPSMAIKWRIGSGDTIAGSYLASRYDNSKPTGSMSIGLVPSMRVSY